jgi:hypothetical protein
VPFEDLVDTQGHAQCLLQYAINLNNVPGNHSGDVEEVKAMDKPTLYITAVMCVCVGAVELLSLVPGRMGGGAEMAHQFGPRSC